MTPARLDDLRRQRAEAERQRTAAVNAEQARLDAARAAGRRLAESALSWGEIAALSALARNADLRPEPFAGCEIALHSDLARFAGITTRREWLEFVAGVAEVGALV